MNFEKIGQPITKITLNESAKTKQKRKKRGENEPNFECEYCYKVLNSSNKARHLSTCYVKKACKERDSTLIYVHPKDNKIKNYLESIECESNYHIQQIPNRKKERQVLYITGAQGSGKSYYSMLYIKEYQKMFPKNPIYVISALPDDKDSLDKVKGLKRFKLDEKFTSTTFSIKDFNNSLIIFDDIDSIRNMELRKKIYGILDNCINIGRHENVSIIYTSHMACSANETKIILNSSDSVTFFKLGMGNRAKNYLLKEYYGLDKTQIEKISKLESRWITITRTYPMICLYETGAFMLNN